jgi:hypothetical protein
MKRNYTIMASIPCVLIVVLFALTGCGDQHHKNDPANAEKNHDVMKYFVNDNEEYVRLAFTRLESEFQNPNDFKLDAFSVRKRDTVYGGNQDTIFNVYFTYYLSGDNENKYFSKVSVFASSPTLQLYNIDTRTNSEYRNIKTEKEKVERETMESIKESFQQMPDSTKKAIIDTIKKSLKK